MKTITKRRALALAMSVIVTCGSIPMNAAEKVYAAEDEMSADEFIAAQTDNGAEVEETEVKTIDGVEVTEISNDIVNMSVVSGSAVSGSAITEGRVTTWDPESILNAKDGDKGLTLHEGTAAADQWSIGTVDQDNLFGSQYSTSAYRVKAGKAKPMTDGVNSAGKIPNTGCYLSYTATKNGTLTILEKTGAGKTFYVVDDTGKKVAEVTNGTGSSTYDAVAVPVVEGHTYYAYLNAGTAEIWQVLFEEAIKTEWSAEELVNNHQTEDGGLVVSGTWTLAQEDGTKTFADGYPIGKYAKASANVSLSDGKVQGGCYVTFTAPVDGTFALNMKLNNGKVIYAATDDGVVCKEIENNTGSNQYIIFEIDVVKGKTYNLYIGGSKMQIWRATFKEVQQITPWDQVETPVINSVDVDESGNFVVKFNSVIDKALGAENVRITMLCNGLEVTTVNLTAQNDEVVMQPLSNGDYTFYATAQREGYANKKSEVVEYKNYVLAVRKPVIELVQKQEDGAVYVDWLNVPEADSYTVEYRKAGEETYQVAAEGIEDAHVAISGITENGEYDFRISALRVKDDFAAVYENTYTVSDQLQWHFATIGSAQETNAVIKDGDEVKQTVAMSSKDEAGTKQNVTEAIDVTNTDMTVTIQGSTSGKISDGEEGFMYYYTMINPNTTNFELSATYTITDVSLTPDNQTGFGLIATDMLGINYYGAPDYGHKYFNSVSNQLYSSKSKMLGLRVITGYESFDTSSNEEVTRTTNETRYANTTGAFEVGNQYTFTLKKTNEAFIASLNGEELKYDDLSILSVQEDGSICVGFMVSRKVTCEISNVKFTTSESTGVGSATEKEESITPSLHVYSSGTCGAQEYEYIVETKAAGNLVITSAEKEVLNQYVEENEVVKVMIPVETGMNSIHSELTPDENKTYTSYNKVTTNTNVEVKRYFEEGEVIYVSPEGTAINQGTKESPLDINTAVKYAQPGQYIYLLNGVYTGNGVTIARSVSGTAEKPITMVAETAGEVIFKNQGIRLVGSYWHVYGIHVYYPSTVGIQISGNYNTVEMCIVEGSGNTGVQISRDGSADRENGINELLWPSYNLVKNVESFDNCDAGRNDADGFAAKLTCGEGNKFYGCIAHNNIDDGWDLFAKAISGNIGQVTIENCVAYDNGWLTTEDTTAEGYSYGEGNGFKLGGNDLKGGHMLINSVSFNNGAKGITSNSCPDNIIINCTSFNNNVAEGTGYNVGLNKKNTNLMEWKVSGLISYSTTTDTEDLIPFSLSSESNYIYNGHASYNTLGEAVSEEWFVNTDVTRKPERNADGTIDMHGLLDLTEAAPATSGGRLDVTSEDAKSYYPDVNFKQNGVPTDKEESTPTVTPSPIPTVTPSPVPTTKPSYSGNSSVSTVTPVPTQAPAKAEVVAVSEKKEIQNILTADKNNKNAVVIEVTGGTKGNIEVTIDVSSNPELKSGKKAYVYRVDQKSGKLLSIAGGYGYKVDADGKIDLAVASEGEYVVLAKPASSSVIKSLPAQVWSTIDYNVLYVNGEVGAERKLEIHLPECLEVVESLKDETSSKAVDGVAVSYASSNEDIASVSKDGVITAKGSGKAVITIKVTFASGKVKTMKRTVVVKAPEIRVNVSKTEVKVGEQISYRVKGLGYPTNKITIAVQDNGVLEVGEGNKIKAVKAGTSVITVTYDGNTIIKEITVK